MAFYALTEVELERLTRALRAALSLPFIDDIEDFILEAIVSHTKGLTVPDPLVKRTKMLFDVVDPARRIGWSVKGLQWRLDAKECEFVIQRADVINKCAELGFSGLTLECPPEQVGAALVEHWRRKVEADAGPQGVDDRRLCLLLKGAGRRDFRYVERDLREFSYEPLKWRWTKKGLVATDQEGRPCLKWYKSQKQLFEVTPIPDERVAPLFSIAWERLAMDDALLRIERPP